MEALGISLEASVSASVQRIYGVAIAEHGTDRGAHRGQTVQAIAQQTPGRIGESSRDSLLRFRDEWVRNRAREIRRVASLSFNCCSEDTASITALNEFYRLGVFDGFITDNTPPKDLVVAEKRRMCRSFYRKAHALSNGDERRGQWAR
jgi:hypothetical protein